MINSGRQKSKMFIFTDGQKSIKVSSAMLGRKRQKWPLTASHDLKDKDKYAYNLKS